MFVFFNVIYNVKNNIKYIVDNYKYLLNELINLICIMLEIIFFYRRIDDNEISRYRRRIKKILEILVLCLWFFYIFFFDFELSYLMFLLIMCVKNDYFCLGFFELDFYFL